MCGEEQDCLKQCDNDKFPVKTVIETQTLQKHSYKEQTNAFRIAYETSVFACLVAPNIIKCIVLAP